MTANDQSYTERREVIGADGGPISYNLMDDLMEEDE